MIMVLQVLQELMGAQAAVDQITVLLILLVQEHLVKETQVVPDHLVSELQIEAVAVAVVKEPLETIFLMVLQMVVLVRQIIF